jgi:hypothetical protein
VWASLNANRAHKQRRAVATITQLGGRVTYGFDSLAEGEGVLRAWVRRVGYYSFCEPVVEVNLTNCDVIDSDLTCLQDLPDLGTLQLNANRRVDGSGLWHVRGLHRIRTLQVQQTGLNDNAVRHILSLKNLRELYVYGTMIGDDGVSLLSELTSLERLDLARTRITDNALKSVRQLPRLAELWVAGTRVTDGGLCQLEGMQSLRTLALGGLDWGSGAKPVWVGCQVTAEGVADFERKTPWCKVWH